MDWWAKITGVLVIVAFLEAAVILLLDKSMAFILLLIDICILVVAAYSWAPLCFESRAEKRAEQYVIRYYGNRYGFRIEHERTKLRNGEWYVYGYVLVPPNGEYLAEIVLDSRFGKIKPEKLKMPKMYS